MNSYLINEMRIILYAAGGLSCKVEELFFKSGKQIEAYIDQRAEDIETFHGKKVYSLDEAGKTIKEKDRCAVIITTKNVFEHSKIAAQLREKGFSNIIFKDYRILQGRKADDVASIDYAFEKILNQHSIPDETIAKLETNPLSAICDGAYIKEENEIVYAYMPAGMLFTNCLKDWMWSRVNFMTSFLTLDLYKEFELGKVSIRETGKRYVQEFAKKGATYLELNTDGAWEEFVISGRMDVFREMNDLFCLSPEFFIDNAPTVDGNASIGFELVSSGKNRVAFLMAKGYKYIPVKIAKETYGKFVNLEIVKAIEEYISRKNVVEFTVPVPHPFFYKYPSKAPDYYTLWLERVGKDIMKNRFQTEGNFDAAQISLIVVGEDQGASERYFTMLGMRVLYETVKDEFTLLLDRLFCHLDKENVIDSGYDYAVIYDVPNWLSFLEQVTKACYVAGESVHMREKIKCIDLGSYSIDEVFMTYWDKKEYSGYVIRKIGQ